ncbi:MAG TPA: hypothetical protein VF468_10330 [Actinomycetota bacterium]|nr:hypothetical protein [Actinomycetota bacterium]
MRTQRQQPVTRMFLVLAVVLGSLWAGGLAARAADSADQLAAIHLQPGAEPAVLGDRAPVLRPPVGRSEPGGRLVPLLLGLLAASVVVAYGVPARRRRSGSAPARSLVLSAPRGPRAPPHLRPA